MNIDLWLEKALKKVQSTDPDVLLENLESYGLVEPLQAVNELCTYSSECVSFVADSYEHEHGQAHSLISSYETKSFVSAYVVHEEIEFKVAPHKAALDQYQMFDQFDYFSQAA